MNAAGEGEWSEAAQVLSGAGAPEPPTAPVCTVRSAHAICVSWDAPCNNGARILEYKVEWRHSDQQDFSPVTCHTLPCMSQLNVTPFI